MSSQGLAMLKDGQVEVVDGRGRPFCILRGVDALAQDLARRAVAVLATDSAGRLILADTGDGYSVSASGLLLAGESGPDAAARLMLEAFGHAPPPGPSRALRLGNCFMTVFSCRLPGDVLALAPLSERDWLWAAKSEIYALLDRQPDMFAPLFRQIMAAIPADRRR